MVFQTNSLFHIAHNDFTFLENFNKPTASKHSVIIIEYKIRFVFNDIMQQNITIHCHCLPVMLQCRGRGTFNTVVPVKMLHGL